MGNEAIFHVGIKALIFNDKNEVLVLNHSNAEIPFWDLPGGRIQLNQDEEDTLLREIEEELGINKKGITIGKLFDASISNLKTTDGTIHLMLLTYLCKLKRHDNFKLSDEHSEWRWCSIDKAKELLKIKFHKNFIEKLEKFKK